MSVRHYVPSGRFPRWAPLFVLGLGVPLGAAILGGYAWLARGFPEGRALLPVYTLAAAGVQAVMLAKLLKGARVRSRWLAQVLVGVIALTSYAAQWVVWVHLLVRDLDAAPPLFELPLYPGLMWAVIRAADTTWGVTWLGFRLGGKVLWALWALEAWLIVWAPAKLALAQVGEGFCERCQRWVQRFPEVRRTAVPDGGKAALEAFAEADDVGAIDALGPPQEGGAALRWNLDACECGGVMVLSATRLPPDTGDGTREEAWLDGWLLAPDAATSFRPGRVGAP